MKHAPKGPVKADPMEPVHPMERPRCTATNRQGNRCGKEPIKGGTVCRMHGGAAPQVQRSAMERLKELQDPAIQVLGELIHRREYPTVQMAAVRDVLDRTEGKAIETQNVTVTATVSIVEVLKQRHLKQLHARPALPEPH